jgi:hypothetical protein
VGNFYQLRLTEDSRGKVIVGETTFLFQFVSAPPMQAKPQLPLAVTAGASNIDWAFTVIAAFSFLIHFGLAGAINSDWFDPEVDEAKEQAALLSHERDLPVLAPEEKPKDTGADTNADKADKPKEDAGAKKPAAGANQANAAGAKPQGTPHHDDTGAVLEKLDSLNIGVLGATGNNSGPATANVLQSGSSIAANDLGSAATQSGGVDSSGLRGGGGNGTTGPIRGGAGSGVDPTAGAGGSGANTGGVKSGTEVKVPNAGVSGGSATGGGAAVGADEVLGRLRTRTRVCYSRVLQTNPDDPGGSVQLRVTIGPDGRPTSVVPSGTANAQIQSCVAGIIQGATFKAPESGSATFGTAYMFQPSK